MPVIFRQNRSRKARRCAASARISSAEWSHAYQALCAFRYGAYPPNGGSAAMLGGGPVASPRQDLDRVLGLAIAVASVAFIVAANWLPWASSDLGAVHFTPGALTPFMTGIAIVVI